MKRLCFYVLFSAWLGFAAVDDLKRLPDAPGKDTVVRVCTSCHGTINFTKKRLDHDDWDGQVADMVERGAKGTTEELATIADYLAANFGPDAKVNVNEAVIDELKSVLHLSAVEAQAIVQYRQEHGKFKEWRDLLKVPGMDAKKMEDEARLMAF